MSETIDPLLYLRDAITSKKAVTITDRALDFTTLRLPLDTQTAWQRKDKKGFYSLGSLFLSVLMKDSKLSEYAKEAGKLNIPMVNVMDKREVVDYLTGVLETSTQVDAGVRA